MGDGEKGQTGRLGDWETGGIGEGEGHGAKIKDERPTSNTERPTSNGKPETGKRVKQRGRSGEGVTGRKGK